MTYLALMVSGGGVEPHLEGQVLNFLSDVLIPKSISRPLIERYIRKAFINRSWFNLSRFQRALLHVAVRTVSRVKSPILTNILRRIFLTIELGSPRGRALYYGTLLILKTGKTLTEVKERITHALLLGISYLNNPPLYRTLTQPRK